MKDKIKSIFIFLGIIILYIFYSYLIVEIFKIYKIDISSFKEPYKSICLILIELSLMIFVGFIYRKELKQELIEYKNNFGQFFKFGLIWWIIGFILMIVSNIIIMSIYPSQALNEEAVQDVLKQAPIYASFAACIFAPFMEEIIFRKHLNKIFTNKALFILVSGFLFGLVHNISGLGTMQMLYIIPYGVFGLVFAYMYYKKKNIFIPMTFHFIHNTILVILSLSVSGVM